MAFRWEEIDHSLAGLRLVELSTEMNRLIEADEHRIGFEQRGNLNTRAAPNLILRMKQARADEWAHKTYDIYCDIWQKQGNAKSAAFLRAVFTHGILKTLRARAGAIASEFRRCALQTSFPPARTQAQLQSLHLNMRKMEDRWRRRIEIEAKEYEHAERIARSRLATLASSQSEKENPFGVMAELNPQPQPVAGSGFSVPAPTPLSRKRPGPKPKRSESFIVCAGTLWRKAKPNSGKHVSTAQLAQIALELDAAKHLPPTDYLEDRCAREVKDFNSRHSRSKLALSSLGLS